MPDPALPWQSRQTLTSAKLLALSATALMRQEARRLARRVGVLAAGGRILLDDLNLGARDARDDSHVAVLARAQDDQVAWARVARLGDACKVVSGPHISIETAKRIAG